ncbi:hypothetical protein [Nocardia wallacei]|nr:hypothetical protein [Nocardia wallacei]
MFNVVYEDLYRKVDSAWLIAKRVLVKTFEPEQVTPASESAA